MIYWLKDTRIKEKSKCAILFMKRKEENLPFYGMVFVITGTTKIPREDLQMRILELGGRVTSAISGATTYLVTGLEPGPSKLKKALDLQTKIISEEEFIEMSKDYIVQPCEIKKTKTETAPEKWIDKYKPESLDQMIGNKQALKEVQAHIRTQSIKPLLICGAAGTGKTLSVYLMAKELNLTLVEYNGADHRGKTAMSLVKNLSQNYTLKINTMTLHKDKIILLEEIENMDTSDREGLSEILKMFKTTRMPIILTVNDKSTPKIKSILAQCKVIQFYKVDARTLTGLFKEIIKEEGLSIPESTLFQIAGACGGDVRYGINTLQCLCKKKAITTAEIKTIGKQLTTQTIFDFTKEMFTPSANAQKKLTAYFEDPLLSLPMVFENYLEGSLSNIAQISNSLSLADITNTRMICNGETALFPITGYYTCIKPNLRLTNRIVFSKYISFNSSRQSKYSKYVILLSHLQTALVSGGWSVIYTLFSIAKRLSDKTISVKEKTTIVNTLNMDKADLTTLSEATKIPINSTGIKYNRSWN
ncbi:replication factor C subunit 1 [Nematocida sp. AWRm80]|nr:replication factor C subunit 1 [Nematocida sp. AWRm80]